LPFVTEAGPPKMGGPSEEAGDKCGSDSRSFSGCLSGLGDILSEIRERLERAEECIASGATQIAHLKAADVEEANFGDVREESEFEIELSFTRTKYAVKDCMKLVEAHDTRLQQVSSLAAECDARSGELKQELERLRAKEVAGPILAAKAARDLMAGNFAPAAKAPWPPESSGGRGRGERCQIRQTNGECECCGPDVQCTHREMLANRVMDGVFDQHQRLLRRRVGELEKELEKWRKGVQVREALAEAERWRKEAEGKERELADAVSKWAQGVQDAERTQQALVQDLLQARQQVSEMEVAQMEARRGELGLTMRACHAEAALSDFSSAVGSWARYAVVHLQGMADYLTSGDPGGLFALTEAQERSRTPVGPGPFADLLERAKAIRNGEEEEEAEGEEEGGLDSVREAIATFALQMRSLLAAKPPPVSAPLPPPPEPAPRLPQPPPVSAPPERTSGAKSHAAAYATGESNIRKLSLHKRQFREPSQRGTAASGMQEERATCVVRMTAQPDSRQTSDFQLPPLPAT